MKLPDAREKGKKGINNHSATTVKWNSRLLIDVDNKLTRKISYVGL